jgi:hypothetical protein
MATIAAQAGVYPMVMDPICFDDWQELGDGDFELQRGAGLPPKL